MRCRYCDNNENLKKITIKGLPKGINAFICFRCWNIQFEATAQYKKQLIKKYERQEVNRAIKHIIKNAN